MLDNLIASTLPQIEVVQTDGTVQERVLDAGQGIAGPSCGTTRM